MSGIIGVSPDMRSGIVGKYPSKIASDTYTKGGHVLQSWYDDHPTAANGWADGAPVENVSGEVFRCTCTGGNNLWFNAVGGYVGTAGGTSTRQYLGVRFTETVAGNTDVYGAVVQSAAATDGGGAQGYYTIPGTGLKTVSIKLLNKSEGNPASTIYWSGAANYFTQCVCFEIQG